MGSEKQVESVREYWNSRASLGQSAGTQDLILKELELKTIAQFVRPGMKILDAGCGNGITAIELARQFQVDVTGVDYAVEMVKAAERAAAGVSLLGTIQFREGDVTGMHLAGDFDLVYTERVIINLPEWETQKKTITALAGLPRPGGLYVMLENSQDGLEEINVLRQRIGLKPVIAPWHNRYLKDSELRDFSIPGATLEKVIFFSSTYYFLSRVVNAALAAREGKEPAYDAPVNQLALHLPAIGEMGQSRAWVWKRATPN